MAWSVPNTITGTTLVNQTDDLIQGNFDDLEKYVNSTTPYVGTGLAEDQINIVNVTAAQTVSGAKTFSAAITASSGLTGNVTGNATTSSALATPRTITLTGDVLGSVSFDGSANVSISASVSPPLTSKAELAGSPTQSFSASTAAVGTNTTQVATTAFVQAAIYPVGSIYMNASSSANPATLFGFGTWVSFGDGRVLLGEGGGYANGSTGGATTAAHTLTIAQIPSHNHSLQISNNMYGTSAGGGAPVYGYGTTNTGSTGGGGSHSHSTLQPYIVVYMWKRTA